MNFVQVCNNIFDKSVSDYHKTDCVDAQINNPFPEKSIEYYLYQKNWIDTVQWHLEDIIRKPDINSEEALTLKRRIDKSNQERTDLVELIDLFFLEKFSEVKLSADCKLNTESPAWAIDRLSILHLKIFHMQEEVNRNDASEEHKENCKLKLKVLFEQKMDLSIAVDQLLNDYGSGLKVMKVYKQMKMYNDPALNPVLYGKS